MRMVLCRLFFTMCLLVASSHLHAQTPASIGDIVRDVDNRMVPVAVRSSNAELQRILGAAFTAHGAFRPVSEDAASFVFRIDPAGASSVRLEILSGKPLRSAYTQEVSGTSLTNAGLRAADIAVTRSANGLPGIFAGMLAFIGEREGAKELYVSDLFFTEVRRLTNDRANCVQPTLSPDGRSVLYTSYYRNGFPDIYRINLVDGRRESFLSFSGVNTGANYSPNGSRVAVILSGTGNAELYTVGSDSKNMKRLTRNKSIESDPSWSPDGSKLVFASDSESTNKPRLFQISAQGGAMTRIPTDISGYCAEPAWNPVHEHLIAFTIAQAGEFEVALYDAKARQSRTLTKGAGDAVEPCWTRDGRHLIYTERSANSRRLVLLDTETGHKAYLHNTNWGQASQAAYAYPQ